MNDFAQFKETQKEGWKNFAPLAAITTPAAARLVQFAGIVRRGGREFDAVVAQYMESNLVRQDYLLTRARKL
jgi:hypothetical protein